MAQFGLQPNGMIRLQNGTLWNPNDPLPADSAAAFNATPMGNPLQPQTLPSAPQASAAPTGMFGAKPAPVADRQMLDLPDTTAMSPIGVQAGAPDVPKPSFFSEGGAGRGIAGVIGDALLQASGNKPIYAPLMQRRQELQWQAGQDAYKQNLEYQRQVALARFNNANKDDRTASQKDAEAAGYAPGTQGYKDFITDSSQAPVIATVNGMPQAFTRAQLRQQATGSYQKPNVDWAGATAHLRADPRLAPQFDEMFGTGAAAAVLGR